MSAFCVFGMTETVARRLAERQFDTHWAKLTKEQRDSLTPEDSRTWIESRTMEILEGDRVQQVSPPFDAPQFAREWIDLARRTAKARRCEVMVRCEKRDRHGARVISKATNLPVMGWKAWRN